MVVERVYTGKSTTLKVSGKLGGQRLLAQFISEFALDLSTFINAESKKRTEILLQSIGVDLMPFDDKHKELYAKREEVGRIANRAKQHAASLPYHDDAPDKLLSPKQVMDEMQSFVDLNKENQRKRDAADKCRSDISMCERVIKERTDLVMKLELELLSAREKLKSAQLKMNEFQDAYNKAREISDSLVDADISKLSAQLQEIEAQNEKARANQMRAKAEQDARSAQAEWDGLDEQIKQNLTERKRLLEKAQWPLSNLDVTSSGELTYRGQPWDCMSHAEQLVVACSIVRSVKKDMGFVLIDKLEAMDMQTLQSFGKWLEAQGLQAITTRVSVGDECSVVIEDGLVKE